MFELIGMVEGSAQALSWGGIFIVVVVLLMVAFAGQFVRKGTKEPLLVGNAKLVFGFVIGFVFAVAAFLANTYPPVGEGWFAWFGYVFEGLLYGVIVGVLPSGTYELLLKQFAKKQNVSDSKEYPTLNSVDYPYQDGEQGVYDAIDTSANYHGPALAG